MECGFYGFNVGIDTDVIMNQIDKFHFLLLQIFMFLFYRTMINDSISGAITDNSCHGLI